MKSVPRFRFQFKQLAKETILNQKCPDYLEETNNDF